MAVIGTHAGMLESVHVRRRCFVGFDGSRRLNPLTLAWFEISWLTPDGARVADEKLFDGMWLLDLPDGSVPMLTPIFHGERITAHAYLIRVHDENHLHDVVARLAVHPRQDPDQAFSGTPLTESGPSVYPLPIEELVG